MTGMKLLHRNLYVAARDPNDKRCMACQDDETQLHLCSCGVIHAEYWGEVIKLAVKTDMPAPADATIFIATMALSRDTVISRHHSVIWYLGWRCLYAEIVHSRVEGMTLDLERALKRFVSMLIGRLRAYGRKWADWVVASRKRANPNGISEKHRDKKLIEQDVDGSYEIHPAIMQMAKDLGLI